MSVVATDFGVDRLTWLERLDLIEVLWDSLPNTAQAIPLPDWQRDELQRRIAIADANPGVGSTWEEVKARLGK